MALKVHAMTPRLDASKVVSPAFCAETFKSVFPDYALHESVEDDLAMQKMGIDIMLYDTEGKCIHTLDTKTRFPWVGHDTNKAPVIYDDIALEVLTITSNQTNLPWFALPDMLKKTLPHFMTALKSTKSMAESVSAANTFAKANGYHVSAGWSTKDKSIRTVDATWYAIAAKGEGFVLDERKLQGVLEQELYSLYASKSRELSVMRPTMSRGDNGAKWCVINLALSQDFLKSCMDLPKFSFTPFKQKNTYEQDTYVGLEQVKTKTGLEHTR